MCRPTEFQRERERSVRIRRRRSLMKIESVELDLKKASGGVVEEEEPEWVSLVFPPRIDGSLVVVNGSEVAADIPIFITLHRVSSTRGGVTEAVFRSRRDSVEVWCDGLSFEVHYLGQHCLVKGIFRRCKTNMNMKGKVNGDWKVECKWVGNPEIGCLLGIERASMSLVVDSDEYCVITERVVVDNKCRRRRRKCGSFHKCLQDIPEVDEEDDEDDEVEEELGWDCNCKCNCGCEHEMKMEDEIWIVDASFWAICVGLGLVFMISRTSTKTLSLSKFLPL